MGLSEAEHTPTDLQAFLFYLVRDLAPVGYVEHAMAMAQSPAKQPSYAAYPELAAMTARWARDLGGSQPIQQETPVSG